MSTVIWKFTGRAVTLPACYCAHSCHCTEVPLLAGSAPQRLSECLACRGLLRKVVPPWDLHINILPHFWMIYMMKGKKFCSSFVIILKNREMCENVCIFFLKDWEVQVRVSSKWGWKLAWVSEGEDEGADCEICEDIHTCTYRTKNLLFTDIP